VFRVTDDPRAFVLVEAYEDEAALDAHAASAHVQELILGEALGLLDERVRTYVEPL
jgi:quinol monooxygenase YgiN